jgi:hypothetical protein
MRPRTSGHVIDRIGRHPVSSISIISGASTTFLHHVVAKAGARRRSIVRVKAAAFTSIVKGWRRSRPRTRSRFQLPL